MAIHSWNLVEQHHRAATLSCLEGSTASITSRTSVGAVRTKKTVESSYFQGHYPLPILVAQWQLKQYNPPDLPPLLTASPVATAGDAVDCS